MDAFTLRSKVFDRPNVFKLTEFEFEAVEVVLSSKLEACGCCCMLGVRSKRFGVLLLWLLVFWCGVSEGGGGGSGGDGSDEWPNMSTE